MTPRKIKHSTAIRLCVLEVCAPLCADLPNLAEMAGIPYKTAWRLCRDYGIEPGTGWLGPGSGSLNRRHDAEPAT